MAMGTASGRRTGGVYHAPSVRWVLIIAALTYHVSALHAFVLAPIQYGRSSASATDVAFQSKFAHVSNNSFGVPLRSSTSADDDDEEQSSDSKHENEKVQRDKDMDDVSDEKMKQVLDIAAAYNTKEPTTDSGGIQKKLMFLQSLGAITSRGEHATKEQRLAAQQVVLELEDSQSSINKNPGEDQAASVTPSLLGRWELVFCDCGQLFRSSPFFMAGRAVCQTEQQAAQYDWFCDMHRKALAISNIGPVRQIITPNQKLVSEFEVVVGAIPFINDVLPFFSYSGGMPVTITGAIVSTADWTKPENASNNNDMELYMDTVEIKGSNLPMLRQLLDTGNISLKSRILADALEQAVPDMYTAPRPMFRTTYLDDLFRIGRDQDENIFVYVKTSETSELTDYSAVDADLGVARLLEGFNDAVTRFYL
jgi:hypothetical protein